MRCLVLTWPTPGAPPFDQFEKAYLVSQMPLLKRKCSRSLMEKIVPSVHVSRSAMNVVVLLKSGTERSYASTHILRSVRY